jgi:acyl carrier protein
MMTFEQVRDILVETLACDADQVTMETSLTEDLAADSLAIVELMMALEEASGSSIADEDTAGLKTVGDIVRYLNARKA